MKFASLRLVTSDVPRLAGFYRQVLQSEPQGDDRYVEFALEGARLAIAGRPAAEALHGLPWPEADAPSAILEFAVDDVDAERARLGAIVDQWLQEPRDMPWGNRSMLFRDPDGNPVNVFTHPSAR